MENIISGLTIQLATAKAIGEIVAAEEIQARLDAAHELMATNPARMTIAKATNADELLTALASIKRKEWKTALDSRKGSAYVTMLREAADTTGASYADETMTKLQAIKAIIENF